MITAQIATQYPGPGGTTRSVPGGFADVRSDPMSVYVHPNSSTRDQDTRGFIGGSFGTIPGANLGEVPVAASTIRWQLSENSRLGSSSLKTTSHQVWSVANSKTASGMDECLYDSGRRTRSTGKERDGESGLDFFGARYFSAAQGRFTSPDAPFADQHVENPQSWNLYQYGYNNPLANIDIGGRSVWTKVAKVAVQLVKSGNAAAAFAGNVQDFRTLIDANASFGARALAFGSLASEVLPVSIGEVKDAGRLLGVVDNLADAGKRLPDDALVVRGGKNLPEDIIRGTGTHPSGITGVSVESAPGKTLEELPRNIPHGQVGCCAVGQVRQAGGDVIKTSGRSPNHATLTGLSLQKASDLLRPTVPNPARRPPPLPPPRKKRLDEEP